jgi:hypothetical protein
MSLKIIFFSVLLCLNATIIFAQEESFPEPDTNSVYSGFASIFVIPSTIASDYVAYLGGIGSVLINDKIIVGGYGMRKTGMLYADRGAFSGKMMTFGSAGLVGGYTFGANRRIKPVIQCFVGWGGLTLSSTDAKGYAVTEKFNRVGVVSPSLSVDFNVVSFLWLSIGANYMFVGSVNADGYSNSDFSKPGAFFSVKLMTGN